MKEEATIQLAGFSLCTAGSIARLVSGRLYTNGAGMLLYLSPAVPVIELSRSEDYAEEVVVETLDHLSGLVMPHVPQLLKAGYQSYPFITLDDEWQRRFVTTVHEIRRREEAAGGQHEVVAKIAMLRREELIMELLLLMLGQTPAVATNTTTRQQAVASRFLQSLGEKYLTRRTVAYYADEAGLSPRHFSQLVSRQTGRTPMEWIALVTVSHAKRLLLGPDMQVKAVADILGFPEQFTFRKYFKTHTGLSPSEYRKRREMNYS